MADRLPEHNDLIPLLRAISRSRGRKQPGRRYGPRPEKVTWPWLEAPAPMRSAARWAAYQKQRGGGEFSRRQWRQLARMEANR